MALLATKLLLAPGCVLAVSIAIRRWGAAAAGILGGLPVVAGPILLVLTLTHGRSFGARAATGTLLALLALTAFVVVYGRVAGARQNPVRSVFAGWAAFAVGVALLTLIEPAAAVALVLVGAGFAVGRVLLPAPPVAPIARSAAAWWDLPARALAALALVLLLTALSGALGPELSGLIAAFPIVTPVLAVFVHAQNGRHEVIVLLRGFLVGFYGYAAFCFVLAIGLNTLGSAPAFVLATAVAIAVQAVTWTVGRSRLDVPTASV